MSSAPDTSDPPFLATADQLGLGVVFELLGTADGVRRFTHVSPSCEQILGLSAQTLLGDAEAFYGQLSPEQRQLLQAAEADSAARLAPIDLEVAMRTSERASRILRVVASRRSAPDGATAWSGLIIDQTERREMERGAERDRWRVRIAADAAGLGFWEMDIPTNRLFWTERSRAIFGLPPEAKVMIDDYFNAIHPDDRPRAGETYFAACRNGGGDFSSEFRIIRRDGEVRWLLVNGRVLCDGGAPRVAVGTMFDITARKSFDDQRSLVMAELAHRIKNGFAYLTAMVHQVGRGAETVEGYRDALLSRLEAMAHSQDLITSAAGRPLHLASLLEPALEPFGADRFDIGQDFADVTLNDELTRGLALLLHELGTNALKYGALSRPDGRIAISRAEAPEGVTAIIWRETGGPAVTAPTKTGFGSRLLDRALRDQGGQVTARFEPDGFVARLEFPTPV